jgi:Methyltransferase domain
MNRQSKKPEIGLLDHDASRGAAVYTPATLALYDLFVLGFSSSFVWNCPSGLILDLYDQHVSSKHLDIGVGTGYFMDRCRFRASPTIALFDLNPNSLEKAATRLRRYAPTCHVGNVLEPIDIGSSGFGSIGLNYLLHCLPGDLKSKSIVFENLRPLLKDGGTIFGSTILGRGVKHNFLALKLMRAYNARGIFSNQSDSPEDLEAGLRAHFHQCTIRIEGCVALFSAKN